MVESNGEEICAPSETLTVLYILSFLFQVLKFYLNLKAMDSIRKLSNKIFTIIYEIKAFFLIVLLFLIAMTNIFYVTNFYYEQASGWDGYLFETYYIFFGAFGDPNPQHATENWVNLLILKNTRFMFFGH